MKEIDSYIEQGKIMAMDYLPKLAAALLVLVLGLWIINTFIRFMKKTMTKRGVDASLIPFTSSLINVVLKAMLLISVASMVGIQTTSFIAILGAAGLAVGLALQGSLANFAGGVLILLFKPFKVGDVIEAQGFIGSVRGIQIFNTIIYTPDNKKIIIPNGAISSGPITNYSAEEKRRVDMEFGIGYTDDIKKAKETLLKIISSDNRIISDPAEPFVAVKELADSSVNIVVRVWVNASDYWGVFFDMQENVKLTFDKEGISIPFPQRDVHLFQEK
jgi:small conductance mechanosensitive channel